MTKQNKGRKLFAVSASAALVASAIVPVASAASVEDLKDKGQISGYALPFVTALVEADVMQGKAGGNFDPKGNLTRAEAAVMFTKAFGLEAKGKNSFKDLKAGAWYEDFVLAVADNDIVVGFQDGTFGPNNNITRAQAAVMIVKALGEEAVTNADLSKFEDGSSVPAWAKGFIAKAVDLGIITGRQAGDKLYLDYSKAITRQDFAVMFQKTGVEAGLWDAIGTEPEPTPEESSIKSVTAVNKTKVEVKLSVAADEVSKENFTIEGAVVNSATLSEDKKTVTLEVSGLEYNGKYTVAAKNIAVNGEATDFGTAEFTVGSIVADYDLEVAVKDASLIANGADNTEITFMLKNKTTGEVDKNADNIVLAINATYGTLAQKRVTIQDGVATVILTSEYSSRDLVSKIDAQIIEASGDYKDLIGKVVGEATVDFKTSNTGVVDTITLTDAESNQADRVVLFFDKEVNLKNFVEVDTKGNLLYKETKAANAATVTADELKTDAAQEAALHHLGGSIVVEQNGQVKQIKGVKLVPNNPKAVEVVLEKDAYLTDNQKVTVKTNIKNTVGATESSKEFTLTDARRPEVTAVTPEGLNKLTLKFSESVDSATFKIDSGIGATQNFGYVFGEFNPVKLTDARDTATITLLPTYDEAVTGSKKGYFTPGKHSIQISNTKDFAALTDAAGNTGTTQNLTFDIAADTVKPTATVQVQSPEQFVVNFSRTINETASDLASRVVVEIYDETSKKYVQSTAYNRLNASDLVFTKIPGTSLVKVELKEDWTSIYETRTSNKNYYNDKYRLVFKENDVTATANGEGNAEIVLDLNQSGSALNTPDTVSAKITDITATTKINEYKVSMDEPVKVKGLTPAGLETVAQTQSALPTTIIQYIGKDKDGKTVTIDGTLAKFADAFDKEFIVTWDDTKTNPQSIVNAGGSTEWTLVVKSLSDDVGNTVSTETKTFTITREEVNSAFKVTSATGTGLASGKDGQSDVVVLTFSKGVQYKGTASDAKNTGNYTLNGDPLPAGTSIQVVDDLPAAGLEKVIITLPDGTANATNNVITVNKNLVSEDGTSLTGKIEWVINETAGTADVTSLINEANALLADHSSLTAAASAASVIPAASFNAAQVALQNARDTAKLVPSDTNKTALDNAIKAYEAEAKTVQNAIDAAKNAAAITSALTAVKTAAAALVADAGSNAAVTNALKADLKSKIQAFNTLGTTINYVDNNTAHYAAYINTNASSITTPALVKAAVDTVNTQQAALVSYNAAVAAITAYGTPAGYANSKEFAKLVYDADKALAAAPAGTPTASAHTTALGAVTAQYVTTAAELEAATKSTVYLGGNISKTDGTAITLANAVTIEGGGFTISTNNTANAGEAIIVTADVTLKNVKVVSSTTHGITTHAGADLVVENSTITVSKSQNDSKAATGILVNADNNTGPIIASVKNTTINVANSATSGTASYGIYANANVVLTTDAVRYNVSAAGASNPYALGFANEATYTNSVFTTASTFSGQYAVRVAAPVSGAAAAYTKLDAATTGFAGKKIQEYTAGSVWADVVRP